MPALTDFFAVLEQQVGPAPGGFSSWSDLVRALKAIPADELSDRLDRVERTYVVPLVGTDYERWSESKRAMANRAAAAALSEAQQRGEASIEQQRAMMAYTGFGGFRDVGVLPNEYPVEYVRASMEWAQAKRTGGAVSAEAATIMERVRDQYFTSVDVCKATWDLVQRTNPDAKLGLEPSAGIGRFLRVAPSGIMWKAVELDRLMAEMLYYLHPGTEVFNDWFEVFAGSEYATPVDVIVGNPPYGPRPTEALGLDLGAVEAAEDYFTLRCSTLLRRGGTLAFVVPLSVLTRAKSTDTRTRMLRGCTFRGAAVLPSGAFPNVRQGTFVIMLWTRRYADIRQADFNEREQAIAAGDYLSLPEASAALCGGSWDTDKFGGHYLKGEPDLTRIESLYLAPAPEPVEGAAAPVAEESPWITWSSGVSTTRQIQAIGQQVNRTAAVLRHLAAHGLVGFRAKAETLPLRYQPPAVEVTWRAPEMWAGTQISLDEGSDTYNVLSGLWTAGTGMMLDPDGIRQDVYAEDLADPEVLFPSRMLDAWVPKALPVARLGALSHIQGMGKLVNVVGSILESAQTSADVRAALDAGGGFYVENEPYQWLTIRWVHDPHSPREYALGVWHTRDDGVIDLYAILRLNGSAELIGPPEYFFAGSTQIRGSDRGLSDTWGRNLKSQGFVDAARRAVAWHPPEVRLSSRELSSTFQGKGRVHRIAASEPGANEVEAVVQRTLADQVRAYLALVVRAPQEAEQQRMAMRQAVIDYLAEEGNPHPKGPAPLRAVVTPAGALEPVLDQPVTREVRADLVPPTDEPFEQQVSWWSESRGYAVPQDMGLSETQFMEQVLAASAVCLELRTTGPVAMADWAYYSGPPASRLTPIDQALSSPLLAQGIRNKLEGQKTLVLRQWSSAKTIGEMDVNPRSPFVPLECLSEWINGYVRPENKRDDAEIPRIVLRVEDTLMSVAPDDPGLLHLRQQSYGWRPDALRWLIGYYNRESLVPDFSGDGTTSQVYAGLDKKGAANVDKKYVGDFQDWLGSSSWVPAVEAEYNTRFAPNLLSLIPTDPVPLAGQSPAVRLHEHQNQAVRRASLGQKARPALIAYDVGAGKTFVGLATAMRWRQVGAARRPLIAVPTSVLAKWYADGKKLFPQARIGLIGITPGKSGTDSAETRVEKWLRFAAGAYDFCIVGHTALFLDLEPSEKEVVDILSGVVWARRAMGKQIADLRRMAVRLEAARELYEGVKAADTAHAYRRFHPKVKAWETHREAKLKALEGDIEEMESTLRTQSGTLGTDSEMASVQRALRALAAEKPYRPSRKLTVDPTKLGNLDAVFDEDDAPKKGRSEEDEEDAEDEDPVDTDEIRGKKKGKRGKKKKVKEIEEVPIPGLLAWDDIGVDALIVDEAHRFKNLWYPAEKIEYTGGGQDVLFDKKSPWDMFIKTASVHRRHGGQGGVMLLTATPMTNSPLELYSLLCMCAPRVFEDAGIYDKQAFIDRYWSVEVQEVVRPTGKMQQAPALAGFKNLDEMLGVIGSVFDRKSTADLVARGYLKQLPEPIPHKLPFERDPAQTALVRTLVALFTAWTTKEEKEEEEGSRRGATEGGDVEEIKDVIDLSTWGITPTGQLVRTGEAARDTAPQVLRDAETRLIALRSLRLVWMSMLDKIAIDPRMLFKYQDSVAERLRQAVEKEAKYQQWLADKEAGLKVSERPPARVSDVKRIGLELASELFLSIPLADVARYYRTRTFVPKVEALAEYIKRNRTRPQGTCGHVVFCDWVDLHKQIIEALVTRAGIPRSRIATITGDTSKQQRLEIASGSPPETPPAKAHGGFNGREAIVVNGEVLQTAQEPIYDVVIGTSQAMAEGIDLQTRSCAVHHLNLPWEPATLHQRNGRAVRQGNRMGHVDVLYYQTARTFDGLRFDKVAKKAAWWAQMFEGNSHTSNPMAAESADKDMSEVILEMVVEDPVVLARKLEQLRVRREAKQLKERLESASSDWIALNAAFVKARAEVDPQRREALFSVAVRRRDVWRAQHEALIIPGTLEALNDQTVAVDWATGRIIQPGTFLAPGDSRSPAKVLSVHVRTKDFKLEVRERGNMLVRDEMAQWAYNSASTQSWTYEEEKAELISRCARTPDQLMYFNRCSPDLSSHLRELFMHGVEYLVTGDYTTMYVNLGVPVVVLPGGTVLVMYPFEDSPSARLMGSSVVATRLGNWLRANPPEAVLSRYHPDAWSTWIRALRSDQVIAPKVVGKQPTGRLILGEPQAARASRKFWSELTRAMLNRHLPSEDTGKRGQFESEG